MSKGLFDTHTHLNDPWYQEEQIETKEIIESALLSTRTNAWEN
jgi:hypothetical protein